MTLFLTILSKYRKISFSERDKGNRFERLMQAYLQTDPKYDYKFKGAEALSFPDTEPADTNLFHVEKMRFPRKDQKDTIIYNSRITISNIPEVAYEYVVNGKSAIEWVMERYQITTHKESGIRNDPNDWAKEVGNPRYILDLLLSIINVSLQTKEIVDGLPGVRWE
jgi:predicted helicase